MWGEGLTQLLELLLPGAGGVRGCRRGQGQRRRHVIQLLLPLLGLQQQALPLDQLGRSWVPRTWRSQPLPQERDDRWLALFVHVFNIQIKIAEQLLGINIL
ncbi:hypothetical protein FHG61_00565 [Xylella fastidiosa subsp. multiplex]|nr:hypothetical protein [Xylella fastidiosa subsp. multiplex]